MSNVDYYLPEPSLRCPVCNASLGEWQGTDGPCGSFVWKQGVSSPIDQRVAAEPKAAADALAKARLPNVFKIYTPCCSRHFVVEAIGRAPNGTWSSTEVITARDAQRHEGERMEQFKARLHWLQGSHR
jgi:hypothetical protein